MSTQPLSAAQAHCAIPRFREIAGGLPRPGDERRRPERRVRLARATGGSATDYSGHGTIVAGIAARSGVYPGAAPNADIVSLRVMNEEGKAITNQRYMWMSGTSFAAPVVAGAAAQIVARHPDRTPDQVKGALMLTATPLAGASAMAAGVGEIDVAGAAAVTNPPNPNAGLNRFVEGGSRVPGQRIFDAGAWAEASWFDASWDSASWSDASWNSASWSDTSWSDAGPAE